MLHSAEGRSAAGAKPVPMTSKPDTGSAASAPPTAEASLTDIPRYTVVESNVATGGQPTLEGLRVLKDRGFHTVVNLLPKPEEDDAEASMVRELGLEYVSLPVTADGISTQALEEFNRILDEPKHRPIFIHDSTGNRAGAMWYLHRVVADKASPDSARRQAARIGLRGPESDTDLWQAIERVLNEQNNSEL